MLRLAGVLPPLGLALLASSRVAGAAATRVVTIEADHVQVGLDSQRTEAKGNASLRYGDFRLHADQITADRSSGQVHASGGLALLQAGRRLEGDSLEYSFTSEEGVLANARVQEQGVIIQGERVEFSPREIVAHEAHFTTCDRPDPHYSFGARRISLTAAEAAPGETPQSGRLSLEHARVTYRGRRLLTVPRYSVLVGEIDEPGGTPFPVSGFSRDDGPYASIGYAFNQPEDPFYADFLYRYTTLRGVRGHAHVLKRAGPLEFSFGYVRRQDAADREFRPDEMESSLANVVLDRAPEYAVRLPDYAIGRSLSLRAELLQGYYSEAEPGEELARAQGDRSSASLLLSLKPYRVSDHVALSHAVGWRRATYSPGDELTIRFYRHSIDLQAGPHVRLALAYAKRDGSGETPFLFDRIEAGKELAADLEWRLTRRWRVRLVDSYDLDNRYTRDMMVSVTRTVHCLEYTIGWRKSRGTILIGVGLAPARLEEGAS